MQQDEFRTLAGFEEMSFDVSDEKAPMMVSRHRVSQTYLKFSVGYWLAESEKRRLPQSMSCATSKGRKVRRNGIFSLRSEEHTSELQSLRHLVCRLLLEK